MRTSQPVPPPSTELLAAHDGPKPVYVRIQDLIAADIAQGHLGAEERLPPERQLCEQFGVSRATLRRGLNGLVDRGLLIPSQGRGWYVASRRVSEPANTLTSFTALAEATGRHAAARVLRQEVEPATVEVAHRLAMEPEGAVFVLERLRLLDDEPIAHTVSRIPLVRVPGLDRVSLEDVSLYQTLSERYGLSPLRADYAVEAQAAEAGTADLLHVEPGSPLLFAMQTTFDADETPIEIGWMAYRGDRYRFHATLTAQSEQRPAERKQ
jgi:GntR family transcriptional regulator